MMDTIGDRGCRGETGRLHRALRGIAAWLLFCAPGRTDAANLLKLSFASLAVTAVFLWMGQSQFQGGAAHFTIWADNFAHGGTMAMSIAQRSVGYPLLIWLTGYPYHDSLIPLLLIHALMAFAMPLLTYWAIAPVSRFMATLFAALLILSLVPVAYMKFIYHDLLHIFLLLAFAAVAIRFWATNRWRYFFLAVAVATFCTFARPISMLLVPAYLAVVLVYDWAAGRLQRGAAGRRLMMYALGAAVAMLATTANHLHREEAFGLSDRVAEASYTGPQVFYPIYINSRELGLRISPEMGPKTAALFDYLRQELSPKPEQRKSVKEFLQFIPPGSDFGKKYVEGYGTDELIARMFDQPNAAYFQLMTGGYFDPDSNHQVFLDAAVEIARQNPGYVVRFVARNLYHILFDPGYGHSMWNAQPYHKQGLDFGISAPFVGSSAATVAPTAAAEIAFSAVDPDSHTFEVLMHKAINGYRTIYTFVEDYAPWLVLFAGLLCLAALVQMAAGHGTTALRRWFPRINACVFPTLLLAAAILYHALVISVAVEPYYRYHIIIFPVLTTAAAFGVILLLDLAGQALQWLWQRFTPPGRRLESAQRCLVGLRDELRSAAEAAPGADLSARTATAIVAVAVLFVFAFYGVYMFLGAH